MKYIIVLCAECEAQYMPGHATLGRHPCGCFGARPQRHLTAITNVDLDALLSEVSRDFAGAHVNAGEVVGAVRRRVREINAVTKETSDA